MTFERLKEIVNSGVDEASKMTDLSSGRMSKSIECIIELKNGNNVLKIVSNLVRCKDCKHKERIPGYSDYQPNTVFCNKWEHFTDIQGYCYKGE